MWSLLFPSTIGIRKNGLTYISLIMLDLLGFNMSYSTMIARDGSKLKVNMHLFDIYDEINFILYNLNGCSILKTHSKLIVFQNMIVLYCLFITDFISTFKARRDYESLIGPLTKQRCSFNNLVCISFSQPPSYCWYSLNEIHHYL